MRLVFLGSHEGAVFSADGVTNRYPIRWVIILEYLTSRKTSWSYTGQWETGIFKWLEFQLEFKLQNSVWDFQSAIAFQSANMRMAFCLWTLQVTRLIRTVTIQLEEGTTSEAEGRPFFFCVWIPAPQTRAVTARIHPTASPCRRLPPTDWPPRLTDNSDCCRPWPDAEYTHPKNGV